MFETIVGHEGTTFPKYMQVRRWYLSFKNANPNHYPEIIYILPAPTQSKKVQPKISFIKHKNTMKVFVRKLQTTAKPIVHSQER